MSRRSRGRQDAQSKAGVTPSIPPASGPVIRRAATPVPVKTAWPSAQRAKQPWEERCPVCGADIYEEGGTGCCNALVAECEGSVDGFSVDWSVVNEADEDSVRDRLVHHAWFLDTGARAPSDYSPTAGPNTCRCGTSAH